MPHLITLGSRIWLVSRTRRSTGFGISETAHRMAVQVPLADFVAMRMMVELSRIEIRLMLMADTQVKVVGSVKRLPML